MPSDDQRIVVIDTNFVGGGRFRLELLRRLTDRLSKRGHAVAIPEVVVWEWAQHAHEDVVEARMAMKRAADVIDESLDVALADVSLPSVHSLAERIRRLLSELKSVDVVDIEPEHAVHAIEQQVMQTGLGTRGKDGTKTGAADALILQTVERELESYDEVVLATRDRLLAGAAENCSDRVVVVSDQKSLWDWHGLTPLMADDLVRTVADFIQDRVEESLARGGFLLFEHGDAVNSNVLKYADFNTYDVRQTDVIVEGIDTLRVADVEIVTGDAIPRIVVADVTVEAVVVIVNWYIGGSDAELLDEWATVDVEIHAPVTIEFDEAWTPVALDVDDRAEVLLAPRLIR